MKTMLLVLLVAATGCKSLICPGVQCPAVVYDVAFGEHYVRGGRPNPEAAADLYKRYRALGVPAVVIGCLPWASEGIPDLTHAGYDLVFVPATDGHPQAYIIAETTLATRDVPAFVENWYRFELTDEQIRTGARYQTRPPTGKHAHPHVGGPRTRGPYYANPHKRRRM